MEDKPNITIIGNDYVIIGRGMTLQPAPYETIPNYVEYKCNRAPGEPIEETTKRCKAFVDETLTDLFEEDFKRLYPERKKLLREMRNL